MTQEPETLTDLVSDRVGPGRELTYRAFESRAVDPETGHTPSRDSLWKISHGRTFKISPQLIRAVAAGLRLPVERVQLAAAYQFTGYTATRSGAGTTVHPPGAPAGGERTSGALGDLEEE